MKRIGLGLLALALACGRSERKTLGGEAKYVVGVAEVKEGSLGKTLELFGVVRGIKEATVYSEFPGKLIKYTVREGGRVGAGGTVALIDRSLPGMEYSPYPVRSPIAGVVAALYLQEGSQVGQKTPIALVVGGGGLEAVVDVPEIHLTEVKPGMRTMVVFGVDTIEGKVVSVSKAVIPGRGAGTARIRFRGNVPPGAGVRCLVVLEEVPGLLVPRRALVEREGKTLIYKIEGGRAKELSAKALLVMGDLAAVEAEGLSPGDTVATLGAQGLGDGVPVEVKE